jgi:DNA polymerase III subunit delta'
VFILITEKEEDLIQTIRSRCQVVHFENIIEDQIAAHLEKWEGVDGKKALKIAQKSQGDYNKALSMVQGIAEDTSFEEWFISWVRAAFRAKGNASAIQDLIVWSEKIATTGRETQKKFLHFCIETFRQAMLLNYEAGDLVYFESSIEGFDFKKFAPFITGNNISAIYKELSDAIYHIERNGNAKIILTDLSIKLTRLIHKN